MLDKIKNEALNYFHVLKYLPNAPTNNYPTIVYGYNDIFLGTPNEFNLDLIHGLIDHTIAEHNDITGEPKKLTAIKSFNRLDVKFKFCVSNGGCYVVEPTELRVDDLSKQLEANMEVAIENINRLNRMQEIELKARAEGMLEEGERLIIDNQFFSYTFNLTDTKTGVIVVVNHKFDWCPDMEGWRGYIEVVLSNVFKKA